MAKVCKRAIVKGRVQGVYYRGSTQQQAESLAVVGYAKNLQDGSVEVLMCGDGQNVQRLIDWLHTGPALSRVESVEVSDTDEKAVNGFEVL